MVNKTISIKNMNFVDDFKLWHSSPEQCQPNADSREDNLHLQWTFSKFWML